jgi:hypothetical protein
MKFLPELLVLNGQKVMCLKVKNIRWLDSINHLAMPLQKLSEALGLKTEKNHGIIPFTPPKT